jgi:nicotinamide mononucleotide transporter
VNLADIVTALEHALGTTSPVEAVAAVLGIAYVLLVIGQYRICWVVAFLSTVLYLAVFYRAALYMQAALQVFYLAAALYGWREWGRQARGTALAVTHASWRLQALGLLAVCAASALTASWLARETHATHPLLDSLTTWASVFTTWLVARKKLENWLWWLVIDALIAVLCWQQQLYASMILYASYVVLVIIGWRSWLKAMATGTGTEQAA